jgi:hypothetical protein
LLDQLLHLVDVRFYFSGKLIVFSCNCYLLLLEQQRNRIELRLNKLNKLPDANESEYRYLVKLVMLVFMGWVQNDFDEQGPNIVRADVSANNLQFSCFELALNIG